MIAGMFAFSFARPGGATTHPELVAHVWRVAVHARRPPIIVPGEAPIVTESPRSQTILAGQSATLHVVVTGTAPLAYQWFADDHPILDATTDQYSTGPLTITTDYYVQVRNAYGSRRSATATVTVRESPPPPHDMKIAYTDLIPDFKYAGDTQPHPDAGFVAVRKPNGYYLCVTPDGDMQERPNDGSDPNHYTPGAWEAFKIDGGYLVAPRGDRDFVMGKANA